MPSEPKDVHPLECIQLINKLVYTSDNHHIGNAEAASKDIFVVKRGFFKIHYYYIPCRRVWRWNNNKIWLKIKENEVIEKYERNKSPDPFRYYVKDYPYYTTTNFPPLAVIKNRGILSKYNKKDSLHFNTAMISKSSKKPTSYSCDLCKSEFSSSEELSDHIVSFHS